MVTRVTRFASTHDTGAGFVSGEYVYMRDLLRLEARRSRQQVALPQQLRQVVTPLVWQEWDRLLAAHPDQRLRSYVVGGLKEGFRIGFSGNVEGLLHGRTRNMPSARDQQGVIDNYLAEECSRGRVLGPLRLELFPQVHPNRFGVIPKGTSGKWRLIVDMSFPKEAAALMSHCAPCHMLV